MTSIIDSIHYKPLKIQFIDIAHSYNCQQEIIVIFHLPEYFICEKDDKIVLHKNDVVETTLNDITVEVKKAKYYASISGCYSVIFSVDMLSGIINDTSEQYRFLYLNSQFELIGASSTFLFTKNPEIAPNTGSIINDLGYAIVEESYENLEFIKSLKNEISNLKDMFGTFYTKIQSALIGPDNNLPFDEYISMSNIKKEKEINLMIETFNKQRKSSSDIVLSELRTLKDDIFCKITQENNNMCFTMKSVKKEPIFDKENIRIITNIISAKTNETIKPQFTEICEKLKEIKNRLNQLKSISDEKIEGLNLNIKKTESEKVCQIPVTQQENKSTEQENKSTEQENKLTEQKLAISIKNVNFEIIDPIDDKNETILEENLNTKKQEVQVSSPQILNEIKENKIIVNDSIIDKKVTVQNAKIPLNENLLPKEIKINDQIIGEPSQKSPTKIEKDFSEIPKKQNFNSFITKGIVPLYDPNMKPMLSTDVKKVNEISNSNPAVPCVKKQEEIEKLCPVCFMEFKSKNIWEIENHVNSHFRE